MMEHAQTYHTPALLEPTLQGLSIRPQGIYVDATFGGGGHACAILQQLSSSGRLFGFDQDTDVMAHLPQDSRFTFVRSNFRYLANFMEYHGVHQIDGILADLGVSSHHFDTRERGFSFRFDAPLDMRMNRQATRTAEEVINTYDQERLAHALKHYGELPRGRQMAAAIVREREKKHIQTIAQLMGVVEPYINRSKAKKEMAQVFQAIRIEVNEEMEALQELLQAATALLKPGGRMAIIAYHSIEDRMVKNFMRTGNVEGKMEEDFFGNRLAPLTPVNKKVIVATAEEVQQNPRARSAKLRVAEKNLPQKA